MNGMVVGVKTNCSALLSSAVQAFSAQTACLDVLTETDKRKITRETAVISVNSSTLPKIWQKSVVGFIRVKRSGIRYNSSKITKKEKKRKEKAAKAAKRDKKTVLPATQHQPAPIAVAVLPELESPTPTLSKTLPILNKKGEITNKTRSKNAVYFEETAYYAITKQGISAKKAATVCQGHWSIEGLHRFKDVQFNEDKNRIKNKNVASALSQIFNYTLNIFTFTGQKSVKIAIETLANNITALFDMVATTKNYQPF